MTVSEYELINIWLQSTWFCHYSHYTASSLCTLLVTGPFIRNGLTSTFTPKLSLSFLKRSSLQKDMYHTPQLLSFSPWTSSLFLAYCPSLPPYGVDSDKSERKEGKNLSVPHLIQMHYLIKVFLHIEKMDSEEMFINFNS